jgi:hypothetical protein
MLMAKSALGLRLRAEIAEARTVAVVNRSKGPGDYPTDPVGYCRDILGVELWSKQKEAICALLQDPFRVLMPSAHSTGKTFMAACAVNWWYDNFDPGVVISTAPDHRSVCDLLWAEIRLQRIKAGLGDLMPASPEMRSAPDHYAKGFTASTGDSFQGRHPARLLIVFDEAAGVAPVFWETCESMFQRRPGHAWLAILNPTDTGCQAYAEDQKTNLDGTPKWQRFSLDALEHPNVKGRGPNDPPVVPNAVTWRQFDEWVQAWCDPIPATEASKEDLEWPEGSGKMWRQGPIFLARARGKWPSGLAFSVWSDTAWSVACERVIQPSLDLLPELGVDVGRYGDDMTSWHVRWGHTSVAHDSRNGWDTVAVAGHCKALAEQWAAAATKVRPGSSQPISWKQIPMKIDDDGVGGGVVDLLRSWGAMVIPIGAGTRSISGRYPNKRSELWFQVADRASGGMVCLGRLPKALQARMRQQALTVLWRMNAAGMREVEPKDQFKARIGRSPDDMDALNLAYLEGYEYDTARFIEGNQSRYDPLRGATGQEQAGNQIERPREKKRIW